MRGRDGWDNAGSRREVGDGSRLFLLLTSVRGTVSG